MKKIIVTGGAGFIGSNLCKILLKNNNNNIICIDNLSSGLMSNIKPLLKFKNFQFINHDIVNPINIEADEIYNLACPASPVYYQKDAIQTFKTSVFGIFNMLELAVKYNAKLLQTSTSEVYGDPNINLQNENYWGNVNPIGIRACYDEGKRCAEGIMFDYYRKYKTKIKIARIFNTYGENMRFDDGRVISNFINQALKNKDITIYGDGSQTRSYCYITDTLKGLISLMNSNEEITGPINIGNNEEYNIIQTAKIILNKTNSKSKISFKKLPADDPKKRKPDITLAKKLLNWKPEISFDTGIEKTINYFREVL